MDLHACYCISGGRACSSVEVPLSMSNIFIQILQCVHVATMSWKRKLLSVVQKIEILNVYEEEKFSCRALAEKI